MKIEASILGTDSIQVEMSVIMTIGELKKIAKVLDEQEHKDYSGPEYRLLSTIRETWREVEQVFRARGGEDEQ